MHIRFRLAPILTLNDRVWPGVSDRSRGCHHVAGFSVTVPSRGRMYLGDTGPERGADTL